MALHCDRCGKMIGPGVIRVVMPSASWMDDFVYHLNCYSSTERKDEDSNPTAVTRPTG